MQIQRESKEEFLFTTDRCDIESDKSVWQDSVFEVGDGARPVTGNHNDMPSNVSLYTALKWPEKLNTWKSWGRAQPQCPIAGDANDRHNTDRGVYTPNSYGAIPQRTKPHSPFPLLTLLPSPHPSSLPFPFSHLFPLKSCRKATPQISLRGL